MGSPQCKRLVSIELKHTYENKVEHESYLLAQQLRTNANIGVGLGFVLQLAGLFAPEIWPISVELGWALVLAGLPAFIWGGMHYAQGKGYSKSFGLLAILGILGLVVLILLPGQESKAMPNAGT